MPVQNFFEKKPKIDPSVFIAPSATIIGDVVIGINSSVWPNVVIRGDSNRVRIGAFTNIQDNVVIDAKQSGCVVLGNNVSIGHGAILHGCHVGHNIIIGMGAIIMENVTIEDWVLVMEHRGPARRPFLRRRLRWWLPAGMGSSPQLGADREG